jgi:dihydrodipicolinate synthase/N-acetylneuraminate lyase
MLTKVRYPRGILISCEVPWDEHEHFLEDIFRKQVRRFLSLGFHHVYIFGTAGEGYAVDSSRFLQVAQAFREETRGERVLPQVGVIGLSTATIRERIDLAFDLGFREFQISLPSWGALNDREVMRFFKDVCLAYPEARFLHYNLLRTKRLLTGSDYRKIVDEVPNLVATKNTSPDVTHTAALMRSVPELQHFFGEASFPTGCQYGECSLLSSFAPLFPTQTLALFEHACAGRMADLFQAQKEYLSAVYDVIGPMLREPLIDGAYDKALLRLGGFPMPLRLLSPYSTVSKEAYLECQQQLDRKYRHFLNAQGQQAALPFD